MRMVALPLKGMTSLILRSFLLDYTLLECFSLLFAYSSGFFWTFLHLLPVFRTCNKQNKLLF